MKIIKNSSEGIKEAAEILSADGVVAFPTETVYGLAGNAYSDKAILKIYKLKKRPKSNPLIVHYFKLKDLIEDDEEYYFEIEFDNDE